LIPLVVFDLDGCLIDSAELIRASYRSAGVDPPGNILACEGSDWLLQQVGIRRVNTVRRAKDAAYQQGLRDRKFAWLPPYYAARRLRLFEPAVLSGAPVGSIDIVASSQWQWPFTMSKDGLRTPAKMRLLGELASEGVYVDDQRRFINLPIGWRFVHYHGQGVAQLYQEITGRVLYPVGGTRK
jgi:hypothetical protein